MPRLSQRQTATEWAMLFVVIATPLIAVAVLVRSTTSGLRHHVDTATIVANVSREHQQLIAISQNLGDISGRLDHMDESINGINGRLDHMDESINGINGRFDRIEAKMEANGHQLDEIHALITQLYNQHVSTNRSGVSVERGDPLPHVVEGLPPIRISPARQPEH